MAAPFPILFIAPADTRGAVMGSSLIRVLGEEIPDARFTLVVGNEAAPLFSGLETLDALVVLDETHPGRARQALKPFTRGVAWGLTVDLRGIGIADTIRTLRRAVLKPAKTPGHLAYESARLFHLDTPPDPILFPYEEAEARARQLTDGSEPILAMAPLTPWMGSTWPLERYNLVAMRFLGPGGPLEGGRLMVLGGATLPRDPRAADALTRAIPRARVIDLSQETDLGLFAAVLKRADLYLGGDTIVTHIAAACAPTLALFGPSDETVNAPVAARARTIRGPRSFEQIRSIDKQLNQSISHMMDLHADPVMDAARALLQSTRSPVPEASDA